jgi:threonine dehydrogenase-like Zn-dependent dehydrogenase
VRALVYTRPGVVELLDADEPQPAADEVVIEVAVVGICGSELHGIHSNDFRRPPLVMGHEFAGLTSDGRRVTVNPLISCGTCDMCFSGREQLCRTREILGIHRPGAFAQYVTVPQRAVHELPADMPFTTAAVIEPLANAIHALNITPPPRRRHDRAGVAAGGAAVL